MNHLLNIVKELFPNLKGVEENEIKNAVNDIVGFSSTFYDDQDFPIGGGTALETNTARRIAVAETIERGLYRKIRDDFEQRQIFLLDEIDSTLGFACGFERDKTAYRSFCEAIEKWCLSQVFDYQYILDPILSFDLNNLSKHLVLDFSEIYFYQKKIQATFPLNNKKIDLTFIFFIGLTENGIFPGSHVVSDFDDKFTHAIVESWRNLKNYHFLKKTKSEGREIIEKRILFYGENKDQGLKQLNNSYIPIWKWPTLRIFKEYQTNYKNVYLFRTLMNDFIPLSVGTVDRFII